MIYNITYFVFILIYTFLFLYYCLFYLKFSYLLYSLFHTIDFLIICLFYRIFQYILLVFKLKIIMSNKNKGKDSGNLKQEEVLTAVVIVNSFDKRFYPFSATTPKVSLYIRFVYKIIKSFFFRVSYH